MGGQATISMIEHVSSQLFDDTLEALSSAIAEAGLILFSRFDIRQGRARRGWKCLRRPC